MAKICSVNVRVIAKLLLVLLFFAPLAGCLQTPKDRAATTGEQNCIMLTDVFTINEDGKMVVDPTDPAERGVTDYVVSKVSAIMFSAVHIIYNTMAGNAAWLDIINTLIGIMIALYGLGVLLGVVQATPYMVIMNAMKIVFIWFFATNWGIFNDYVIMPVEDSIRALSQVFANIFSLGLRVPDPINNLSPNENVFTFVDQTITMMFASGFFRTTLASFTTGWNGAIYGLLMMAMLVMYTLAVVDAVKHYLMALIARSLLFALAPLFLIFKLFKQTESIFDGWLEQIINFSLQPIFLMAMLGLFQMLIMGFMSALVPITQTSQKVCYGTWMQMSGWLPYLYADGYGDGGAGSPKQDGTNAEIPLNIWVIMVIIFLCIIMQSMLKWAMEIAGAMSGGVVSVGGIALAGWDQFKSDAVSPIKESVQKLSNTYASENRAKGISNKDGGGASRGSNFSSSV